MGTKVIEGEKMKKLIYLFVIAMLVSGCAYFSSQRYPIKENYAPTNPDKVAIFKFPPPTPYQTIGEVEAKAAPASNWDSLHRRLKEEAAKMGGDAIIVQEGKEFAGMYNSGGYASTTGNAQVYGNSATFNANTYYSPTTSMPMMKKRILGVVIKYKEDKATAK